MASQVTGVDAFIAALSRTSDDAAAEMARANRDAALIIQRNVVPRVPVRTGRTRAAFADPSAVGLSRRADAPNGSYVFGLITPELRRRGYRAHWLEYGTKGYTKGVTRTFEVTLRSGKRATRKRKIARTIPAHPAQPFFRPGVEASRAEVAARYREAAARALAKR